MGTVHANGPAEALWRLETLALSGETRPAADAVRRQLQAAVDLVVHLARRGERAPGGSGGRGGAGRPGGGVPVLTAVVIALALAAGAPLPALGVAVLAMRQPLWLLAAAAVWAVVARRRSRPGAARACRRGRLPPGPGGRVGCRGVAARRGHRGRRPRPGAGPLPRPAAWPRPASPPSRWARRCRPPSRGTGAWRRRPSVWPRPPGGGSPPSSTPWQPAPPRRAASTGSGGR